MKPDIRRLKARRDFLRVAAARRKRVMPGVVVQVARRPDAEGRRGRGGASSEGPETGGEAEADAGCEAAGAIRVGFTASRKVGRAVARNRARRRLRAAAAAVLPEMAQPGHDYVLVARKETLTRPYTDLVADLRRALANLGNHKAPASRHRPRKRPAGDGPQEAPGDTR